MNLLNSPWKVQKTDELITVLDSQDFDVVNFDLSDDGNYLPGTIEDEELKAKAIALLPEILVQLGQFQKGHESEDSAIAGAAEMALLKLYGELKAGT